MFYHSFPEYFCLCFKVIAITITQISRGEEKGSIPVSNSCYHRGGSNQFQKMCLSTRVVFTYFGDIG